MSLIKPIKHFKPIRFEGRNKRAVVLPLHPEIVKRANIQPGTYFEQVITSDGAIKLRPMK